MRVAIFGTKNYDRRFLAEANGDHGHDLVFFEPRLEESTAALAEGFPVICVFVNDRLDAGIADRLAAGGTKLIALRCAGYNNVDLKATDALGLSVVRVPGYSPHAVAEFTIALLLALDRKVHRAWARVRENNFALDGLIGRTLHGRTVGVIGTGKIGALVARALRLGFGCNVLASDVAEDPELKAIGVTYVPPADLLAQAEIVSLHCPLTPETRHIINSPTIEKARDGLIIVNTSRGALIDTRALIAGLKSRRIGGVALDVYEQEADLFFEDLSDEIIEDDDFQRLLTFPNVLVTGHQAFLTAEALTSIACTTLSNISDFEAGRELVNRVDAAMVR